MTDQTVLLRSDPDHRLADELVFLAAFPGYTTERTPDGLLLWWRGSSSPRRLLLQPCPDGVRVRGDPRVAAHVLHTEAPPLPPVGELPARPEVHRLLRRRYGGIRPVLFADAFEGIAWAILGQQITVTLAARLKRTLSARYGPAVAGATGEVHVFPSAEDLAAQSPDDLRGCGLSGAKARALIGVAQQMVGGWDPWQVRHQDGCTAQETLQRLPGVGPWTSGYILLRVIGHPDVFPAGDAGLARAFRRLTGLTTLAPQTLAKHAAVWAGCRSDFAFSLWLDNMSERERAAAVDRKQGT